MSSSSQLVNFLDNKSSQPNTMKTNIQVNKTIITVFVTIYHTIHNEDTTLKFSDAK